MRSGARVNVPVRQAVLAHRHHELLLHRDAPRALATAAATSATSASVVVTPSSSAERVVVVVAVAVPVVAVVLGGGDGDVVPLPLPVRPLAYGDELHRRRGGGGAVAAGGVVGLARGAGTEASHQPVQHGHAAQYEGEVALEDGPEDDVTEADFITTCVSLCILLRGLRRKGSASYLGNYRPQSTTGQRAGGPAWPPRRAGPRP